MTTTPNYPTAELFAKAVFPNTITGVLCDDTSHGKKNSQIDCDKQIFDNLTLYGYHPVLLTNTTNIKQFRKVDKEFAKGHGGVDYRQRTNYIYCGRCMNNCKDKDQFMACVIAAVTYKFEVEPKRVVANVVAIYPHPEQCNVKLEHRRNYLMDQQYGGAGYVLLDFPVDEIAGNTYSGFVDKLNSIDSNGIHYGEGCKETSAKTDIILTYPHFCSWNSLILPLSFHVVRY